MTAPDHLRVPQGIEDRFCHRSGFLGQMDAGGFRGAPRHAV